MLLSEGQMSDYKGAALMPPALPKANELLADNLEIAEPPLPQHGSAVRSTGQRAVGGATRL